MVGAGAIPIAIPLCWCAIKSPNLILLFFITIVIASTSDCGDRWGYSVFVGGLSRKEVSLSMQSFVLIFVYIDIASYVKMEAFGGREILFNIFLSVCESLK